MTQKLEFKEMALGVAFAAIDRQRNNPAGILRAGMEVLEEISNGGVTLVDPTNPTVLMLEMISSGFHGALESDNRTLRDVYPSLAENESNLADHITDWDNLNMFASPATQPFDIFIGLNAFLQAAVRDEKEKCRKVIIPRDSTIHKAGRIFTLHYPLVLRHYDLGNLEISYDASVVSNFQALETNIIPNKIVKLPNEEQFIMFNIPVQQVEINRSLDTTSSGQFFNRDFEFTNQFHYARAWYRNSNTQNHWKEMATSHGRMNYDRRVPTMLFTVGDQQLNCRIPQIYMAGNRLLGEIAIDIYTTEGIVNERIAEGIFEMNFRNLDQEQNSIYTPQALSTITRWASPSTMLTGGKNGLNFEQKRERVIHNAMGPIEAPITQTQFGARLENSGFNFAKNVDVVTERVFQAFRELPPPSNKRLITTANIGVQTFITDGDSLREHEFVHANNERWTILPKNLYEYNNGVTRLLSAGEVRALKAMEISSKVTKLNTSNYLYTPFHYVLDNTAKEFDMRAYYLDKPVPSVINFVSMNSSMQLVVNTDSREIVRTETGYQLRIKVLSGNFFKQIPDSQVAVQLRFKPKGDSTNVFLLGRQIEINGGERIFAFDLETDYDINSDDAIHILNVGVNGVERQSAWIDLETEFHIFICSNNIGSNYQEDSISSEYAAWQLPEGFVPITHEQIKIRLGYALSTLWRRVRNHKSSELFETYPEDVLQVYEEDFYGPWSIDPVTGKPSRDLLFPKGALVTDPISGEPYVVKGKARGDVIYEFGVPVAKIKDVLNKEIDLLMIDGRHYFVDDKDYLDYNQELVDVIVTWVMEGMVDIQKRSLDKTKVTLHPRTQIGNLRIEYGDSRVRTIPAEQSPHLELYLRKEVIEDEASLERIRVITVKVLDEMLKGRVLNSSEITDRLRDEYGGLVASFKLFGFGASKDIHYAVVVQEDRSLALKRLIVAQGNGKLIMREDVTLDYRRQ